MPVARDRAQAVEAANHCHLSTNSHTSKAITITIAMPSMTYIRSPRAWCPLSNTVPKSHSATMRQADDDQQ
jgi:hypothetical protein